jgi:hypothetical protein
MVLCRGTNAIIGNRAQFAKAVEAFWSDGLKGRSNGAPGTAALIVAV